MKNLFQTFLSWFRKKPEEPSEQILPKMSLKDAFLKEYAMFQPPTFSTPSPEPAGTPSTLPSLKEAFLEEIAPLPKLPDISLKPTPQEFQSLYYRISTSPTSTSVPSSFLDKAGEFLKWGVDTFLKYHTMRQSQRFYSDLAKAQIEAKKAEQAIAEAQARIAQLQKEALEEEKGEEKKLSQEALKKYAPYLLPIAVGLTVVMILTARKK